MLLVYSYIAVRVSFRVGGTCPSPWLWLAPLGMLRIFVLHVNQFIKALMAKLSINDNNRQNIFYITVCMKTVPDSTKIC